MLETIDSQIEVLPLHHEWEMAVDYEPETEQSLRTSVERAMVFLDGDEAVADEPDSEIFDFEYDPDEYNTWATYWDYDSECEREERLTLAELLADDGHYYSGVNRREVHRAEDDVATDYLEQRVEPAWWRDLSTEYVARVPFHDQLPTEQFIIGQEDRGVRFYNFSAPMDAERVEDCRKFVDILTQYYGDRVYDFVTDVVITDFNEEKRAKKVQGAADSDSSIFLVDSKLLSPDMQDTKSEIEGSRFLEVLVHEAGHLVHGSGDQADEQLLKFAQSVGWDVDAMVSEEPHWLSGFADLEPYAPRFEPVVKLPDGSRRRMDWSEAADQYGTEDYDDDGNYAGPDYYVAGSPSNYGEESPQETSAESSAHAMLGRRMLSHMPETRDAWLEHVQQRVLKPGEKPEDRPIATRLDRAPIIVDHRTGNDMLYPQTKLPKRINVRLHPVPSN